MPLHVGRAVADDGIAHGVSFIEGVAGEVQNLVIDAVGNLLRHTVGNRTGNVTLRIAVDKGNTLGINDGVLLLAHGAADHIRLAQGETRQLTEDLNDLLLIDNAAIGDLENGAEQLVLVGDFFWVLGALDEAGDGVHGAGAIEGNDSGDVFNAAGPDAGADGGHAGTFQLEDAHGPALGQHFEGGRIVLRHILHTEGRIFLAYEAGGILQNGEVAQAEKVHLQQAQLLQRGHLVLADGDPVVGGEGDIFADRLFRDDDAGSVGGGVTGHALQGTGDVQQAADGLVPVIELPKGFGEGESLVDGHVQSGRDLFGNPVGVGITDIQHTAHVADGHAGSHGAEGDNLGNVVIPVEAMDIVNNLTATVDTEVNVDIRHGDTLGVQKPLEKEAVFDGVNVGDLQAVGHNAARCAASPGADGDAAAFGIADEV